MSTFPATHFPLEPSEIIAAMLVGVSVIKRTDQNPTAPIRSLARIEDDTIEAIDAAITPGLPAVLMLDAGGVAASAATHKQRFSEAMTIRILALSGTSLSKAARIDGTDLDPGCERLLSWATYLAVRAVEELDVNLVIPKKREPAFKIQPGKYVASWDISLQRQFDIWDDAPLGALTTLGIVANPLDPEQLFLEDNETPNIADPETQQGGVTEL
jgi:hypothetical protein